MSLRYLNPHTGRMESDWSALPPEHAPGTIGFDERGWWVDGRCYASLADAGAALDYPRLSPGQDFVRLIAGRTEGLPAEYVLRTIADGLVAMCQHAAATGGDLPEDEVERTLTVCAARMLETARAIGSPPEPIDGPF